jgi:hypothetical protein
MNTPTSGSSPLSFGCPLCAEILGYEVPITVELATGTGGPEVTDLFGCAHAAVFGTAGVLRPDQERRLIDAAMVALEAQRGEARQTTTRH